MHLYLFEKKYVCMHACMYACMYSIYRYRKNADPPREGKEKVLMPPKRPALHYNGDICEIMSYWYRDSKNYNNI